MDDAKKVDTDNWRSSEATESRDALVREARLRDGRARDAALALLEAIHHKTPRQLLGYLWGILSEEQKQVLRLVLDVTGRKSFLSLGSNLVIGPLPQKRSDDPKQIKLPSGEYIADFDGSHTPGGSLTPRSSAHRELFDLLQNMLRGNVRSLDKKTFYYILRLLEAAEQYHYFRSKGEVLEDPAPMWDTSAPGGASKKRIAAGGGPRSAPRPVRDLKKAAYRADWARYEKIREGDEILWTDTYYDSNADLEQIDQIREGERGMNSTYRLYERSSDGKFDSRMIYTTRPGRFDRPMADPSPPAALRSEYDHKKHLVGRCAVCNVITTQTCAGCRRVYYCGKDHQRAHWAAHKLACPRHDKS